MKKRVYIAPSLETVVGESLSLLSGSGVGADGIGYGGVDHGALEPNAPILDDLDSYFK